MLGLWGWGLGGFGFERLGVIQLVGQPLVVKQDSGPTTPCGGWRTSCTT